MPAISVVLPVRNAVGTIDVAVDSVLEQTFDDVELIVVDDGSDDGTADRLARRSDPRLRIETTPPRGVVAAANLGTRLARAPLIARMDADDRSHPRRLERQHALLTGEGLDAVGCRVRIVDPDGEPVASLARYERWINDETPDDDTIRGLRFVELPLVNPTILARRSYFERGFRDGDLPEDYDLFLRAANGRGRFGKVDEALFDWIDHPDRATRTHPRYTAEAFDRCRREHLRAGPLRGVDHVDLWGVGRTGKPWLRWLLGQGVDVRRAFDVSPRLVGRRVQGVPVHDPSELSPADGTPIVIAVGAEDARGLIRPVLEASGYVVGGDAWFVA